MKTSFKKLLFVCASVFFTTSLYAQNVWSVSPSPLKIQKGGSLVINFNLNMTTDDIRYVAFKFALPEGVTLSGFDESKNTAFTADGTTIIAGERMSGLEEKCKLSYIAKSDVYKAQFNLGSGNALGGETGTDATVFSIKIAAAEDASVGTEAITISELQVLNESNEEVASTFENPSLIIADAATAEDITLANEWNTYCSTNDLDFSSIEGVKAYVVSDVTATSAKLEAVTVVPAGVGFLIKGTAEQKISVPFAESAGSVTSKLVGVTTDTTLDGGNYVLSGDQFVLCSEGGTLPAHKAYLPGSSVTSGAKAFGFDFGDATGINEAKAAKADGAIYSISGVRVAQPQKGVYIMNGRKVIVK